MVHVAGDPNFVAWANGVDTSVAAKLDTTTASATFAALAGGSDIANSSATTGSGKALDITTGVWSSTVDAGTRLSALRGQHHNTGSTDGQFYLVEITTETDVIDTGAGIAVFNVGKSDNIYLSVQGKSGASASAPTGLGVDLNRGAGITENSTANTGCGVTIFDWSSTNQGVSGPRGLYLSKANNRNSDHKMVHIEANRRAVVLDVQGGADASQSLLSLIVDGGSTERLAIRAGGDIWHTVSRGVYLDMSSGNDGYMIGTTDNQVDIRGGSAGLRILNNAGNAVNLLMSDAGAVTFRLGTTYHTNQTATFEMNSGNSGYVTGTTANQLDLRGGASGFRLLNNAGSAVNLDITDAGAITTRAGLSLAGNLTMFDALDIVLQTTTGTRIGTAFGQKLAFYGSTPIVRPSVAAAATDAATTQALANSLRTALINLGLMA